MLYLVTTRSFVSPADVGEYQTMARVGGIAHSGYAPVVLLLRLFGLIPLGTFAFRANLLSCVSGALSVGLAAFVATRLTGNRIASVVAALGFALARATWKESTEASVHAPALAMDAIVFLLLLRFARRPDKRGAFGIGLIGGLAALSHLSAFSLVPVVLAAGIQSAIARRLRPAHLGVALAGLVLGLSPIVYMIASDRPDRPMNYIEDVMRAEPGGYFPKGPVPVTRVERMTWLLSGQQYLALPYGPSWSPESPVSRARWLLAEVTLNEFPLWGLLLALWGAWALWRRRVTGAWLAGLWVVSALLLTIAVASGWIAAYFFLPGLWGLTLAIAAGLDALSRERKRARLILGAVLLLSAPVLRLSFASPPGRLARHGMTRSIWFMWPKDWSPLRKERGWDEYGRAVMRELPARAAVLTGWGEGNVLRYFCYADPLRPDVRVVLTGVNPARMAHSVALERAEGRPVFSTYPGASSEIPGLTFTPVRSWPLGNLWRVDERDSTRSL